MKLQKRLMVLIALVYPSPGEAQTLDDRLATLAAVEPSERIDGFYSLIGGRSGNVPNSIQQLMARHPGERDMISQALIRLLEREASRLQLDPPMMTEVDGEYVGDLISAVTTLQDRRAVNALLPMIRTGHVAMNGLAMLGDDAVTAIVSRMGVSSPEMRGAASETLGLLAQRRSETSLSQTSISAVRATLLQALGDHEPNVRIAAIRSLSHFSDQEVHDAIARLATTDAHSVTRNGRAVHPVRDAAREWLNKHTRH